MVAAGTMTTIENFYKITNPTEEQKAAFFQSHAEAMLAAFQVASSPRGSSRKDSVDAGARTSTLPEQPSKPVKKTTVTKDELVELLKNQSNALKDLKIPKIEIEVLWRKSWPDENQELDILNRE